MQLTNPLLLAFIASTTSALPTTTKSMATANAEWTLTSFTRTCPNDLTCSYSFGIDTQTSAITPCSYDISSLSGSPTAADTNYGNIKCGIFTISSGWSDQFGAGDGFSTLAVTDGTSIVYPAYTDVQLASGVVVSPDQSYPVQSLP